MPSAGASAGVRNCTCTLPGCPVDLNTRARLQVRSDCSPETLQEFLASDTADEAEETAISLYNQEDEEAALLEEVCHARRFPVHLQERRLMQLAQPRRLRCRSWWHDVVPSQLRAAGSMLLKLRAASWTSCSVRRSATALERHGCCRSRKHSGPST